MYKSKTIGAYGSQKGQMKDNKSSLRLQIKNKASRGAKNFYLF